MGEDKNKAKKFSRFEFDIHLKSLKSTGKRWVLSNLLCPLLGDHQVNNFALALLASVVYGESIGLSEEKILDANRLKAALANTNWLGRFEVRKKTGKILLYDCAHTVNGAKSLRKTLDQLFPEEKITFILGFLKGKKWLDIVRILNNKKAKIIFTQPDSPRALLLDYIKQHFQQMNAPFDYLASPNAAFAKALKSQNKLICMAGSLYLYKAWHQLTG